MNAPEDITVECTDVPDAITLEITDNCDVDPDVVFDEQVIMQACGYVIIRTYEVSDLCGNEAFAQYTVTVVDTEAPMLSALPADTTVSCGEVPMIPAITAFDLCQSDVTMGFSQFGYDGESCSGTLTRVWTAADECGNTATHTQVITIVDEQAPVLEIALDDLNLMCDDELPSDLPVFTDNCDMDVEITESETTNSITCGIEIIRTFTATDDCGNETSTTQTITITDQESPVLFNVPADATVECDNIPVPAEVVATDDCSDVTVEFDQSNGFGCPYTIVRTWSATDECGNTTTATQTLTVVDTTLPEFQDPPADMTVECDQIPEPSEAFAIDNCSDITMDFSELITDGCPYQIIRTWVATDACGNAASHTQTISIIDTQAPTLNNVPADIMTDCGEAPAPAAVTATDNCSTNLVVVFDENVNSTSCPISITRTWTVTDACGNIAQATQNIVINDEDAPVLSELPENMTVECDNIPSAPEVTATDNCADVTVEFNEIISDGCPYTITRTWSSIDDCENEVTHTQVLTVVDTQAPVFTNIPADFEAQCGDLPAIETPDVSDNCSVDLDIVYNEEVINESCPLIIERSWTTMDGCGNVSTATQLITFNDDIAPVMTGVPSDETVECDSIPAFPNVTAEDNCDNNPSVEIEEVIFGQGCNYEIVRTFTATDACGNSSQEIQTIFVVDTQAPVASNEPANITIECGDELPTDEPSFTDNCDSDLIVTFSSDPIEAPCGEIVVKQWMAVDDCGNTTIVNQIITITDTTAPEVIGLENVNIDCSDDLPTAAPEFSDICDEQLSISMTEEVEENACGYILTRTWTATDDCSNSTSSAQVITVTDNNSPEITAPEDLTVECDAIPAAGNPIASDLCDEELDITFEETISDGCPYVITRTWTATDDCGNSSSATQVIDVIDSIEPVLSGVPADATISCESIPEAPVVTAIDNCSTVNVVLTETTDYDECPFILTRTWTATDECGNVATASQNLTIIDNTEPVLIDFEGAISVQCDATDEIYISAEDNCSEVSISIVSDLLYSGACIGTIERTYLIEDECGNAITAVQYLFIEDDFAPTFDSTPEEEITILCGDPIPDPEVLTATDNCDADVEITVTDVASNSSNCPYTITRTYAAEDECGNVTEFVQYIDVVANPLANQDGVVITSSPNPFSYNNSVTMTIPQDGYVQFSVVNTLGQEIEFLMEGEAEAEILYEFELHSEAWEDGIYYLKLFYNGKFESHKIMKVN